MRPTPIPELHLRIYYGFDKKELKGNGSFLLSGMQANLKVVYAGRRKWFNDPGFQSGIT
jgi:hypothetical protein